MPSRPRAGKWQRENRNGRANAARQLTKRLHSNLGVGNTACQRRCYPKGRHYYTALTMPVLYSSAFLSRNARWKRAFYLAALNVTHKKGCRRVRQPFLELTLVTNLHIVVITAVIRHRLTRENICKQTGVLADLMFNLDRHVGVGF